MKKQIKHTKKHRISKIEKISKKFKDLKDFRVGHNPRTLFGKNHRHEKTNKKIGLFTYVLYGPSVVL